MNTHLDIKTHRFQYNECDKSFVTSKELNEHIIYNHINKKTINAKIINAIRFSLHQMI
jgi:hypothetical protein